MKTRPFPFQAICVFLMWFFACSEPDRSNATNNNVESSAERQNRTAQTAALSSEEILKKGEHLIVTSGCDDCHSPKKYQSGIPETDKALRLSGYQAKGKLAPYDLKTVKNGWVMTNQHFTAWVGPWGTSFASNLTSDSATGIGTWSEAQFSRALREGKYHGAAGGRPLLPPMPWPNFARFSDEEVHAIFSFLKSTKPVNNQVPAPLPPRTK